MKRNNSQWVIILNRPNHFNGDRYEHQEVIGPFKSRSKANDWLASQPTALLRLSCVIRVVQLIHPEGY